MFRRLPGRGTFHQDAMGSGAFDARAHGDQAGGEVRDLRLAGGVENLGFAFGGGGCHHRRLGGADRGRGKHDASALQAARCRSDDQAALDIDIRSERRERLDMHVDRTRSDGAAAGERDARLAETGEQRRQNQHGRAHLADGVVGGFLRDDRLRIDDGGLAVAGDGGAMQLDHAEHVFHVAHLRQVGEFDRVGAQQRGRNLRKGRVFRPGNGDGPLKPMTADDP